MRFLVLILAAAAAYGQSPANLTGFPFQNETLHYKVRWTDGLLLGDAVFSARKRMPVLQAPSHLKLA